MSTKLFEGSDESDNDLQLGTNKDYAKSYNKLRQKELSKKFKDGGLAISESETSSESSDEAEALDPKFDQEFFKTLASLKSKDPAIYDKNTKFFEDFQKKDSDNDEDDDAEHESKKKEKVAAKENKSKPLTLKDYERKVLLEKGGKFEDSEDEAIVDQGRPASPSAVEEERRLKSEFQKVMNADVDSEEEGFGGILKKRVKTKEEADEEEANFVKWLAGKQEHIQEEVKVKLEPLKNYWQNAKLPQSERFLRDYILNKGYVETNSSEIPTYDEIVGDTAPLSEDELELEKQAEFEHKYNFRFEEPDAEFITRYPRTIEQSIRRTNDKRKQKRIETKERKQKEKEQKMKELELVKELKRKEIEDKIEKLKMVTGNDELGFKDEELEDDFNPEAHDRLMQEIFNDEYYQVNEGEQKPECPSDIEELKIENWDNYDPAKSMPADDYEPHCEDDDFNMDCDYDPASAKERLQRELIENTKGRRNRRGRRNRFMEIIQAKKPPFEPEDEKTYKEYIEEYYKLDCEDIIGDIPCRFKYVETEPNDFGLTIEEILMAKNKELNQWASLKKAVQIRPEYVEKKEQRLYKLKAKNVELKRKIFKSLYGESSDEEPDDIKKPNNSESSNVNMEQEISDNKSQDNLEKKSKKKRKRKSKSNEAPLKEICDSKVEPETVTSESNGELREKKLKLDIKTADGSSNAAASIPASASNVIDAVNKKKKNKPKKKKNQEGTQATHITATPKVNGTKHIINPFSSSNEKNKFKSSVNMTHKQVLPPLRNKSVNSLGSGVKSVQKFNKNNSKNKKHATNKVGGGSEISDERLKAYGINPKKFYKKKKYGTNKNN